MPLLDHELRLILRADDTFVARCACGRRLAEGRYAPDLFPALELTRDVWLTQVGAIACNTYNAHVTPFFAPGVIIGPGVVGPVGAFTIHGTTDPDLLALQPVPT
jgi:hypothetical protein